MRPGGTDGPEPRTLRSAVARGGSVGLLLGGALVALALFFLLRPLEAPEHALGIFLPLAGGLVAVGLGVLALGPLLLGDTPRTAARLARVLQAWAVVGLALAVAGVLRSDVPWTAGVLAPVAVVVLLLKDARRLSGAG